VIIVCTRSTVISSLIIRAPLSRLYDHLTDNLSIAE
jgi:hypothetical protein